MIAPSAPPQAKIVWTAAEYLNFERNSPDRHEYEQGEVFLMAGASKKHNFISFNAASLLREQLRGRGCEVYHVDMRVGIPARQVYTYPDVAALCGDAQFEDATEDILLNPQVIIEVLSPSTEKYDQSLKFEHYKALASLQDYLLISQERPWAQHHSLQEGAWQSQTYTSLSDSFALKAVPCTLKLAQIYEQVDFGG
jgi:Uma2 family endonuclease